MNNLLLNLNVQYLIYHNAIFFITERHASFSDDKETNTTNILGHACILNGSILLDIR